MPGYDRARIIGISEDDLEEFICGICLEVFIKPTVTECCGQTYCFDCINDWLEVNNSCPNDRKTLSRNQLKSAAKMVSNLLSNMKIKCDFYESGCQSVVRISDLDKHRDVDCVFNTDRKCPKCDLAQLDHTEQICNQELFRKYTELSAKLNKLEKEQEQYSTSETNSYIEELLSKIQYLELKCNDCEQRIVEFKQINIELECKLRDSLNKQTTIYSAPETPETYQSYMQPNAEEVQWGRRERRKLEKEAKEHMKREVVEFMLGRGGGFGRGGGRGFGNRGAEGMRDHFLNRFKALSIHENPGKEALIQKFLDQKIISNEVALVMKSVDRAKYCPTDPYSDKSQHIGFGVEISAPNIHARVLESLKDKLIKGAKVLDIGSGSGYLTACMAYMVAPTGRVVGIDKVRQIVDISSTNILQDCPGLLDIGAVLLRVGDGRHGYPSEAPYDVIHVGAYSPTLPQILIDQLKPGGRMVIPIGSDQAQNIELIDKKTNGSIKRKTLLMRVLFQPLTD